MTKTYRFLKCLTAIEKMASTRLCRDNKMGKPTPFQKRDRLSDLPEHTGHPGHQVTELQFAL